MDVLLVMTLMAADALSDNKPPNPRTGTVRVAAANYVSVKDWSAQPALFAAGILSRPGGDHVCA